jgi:hypothetical protein
MDRPKIVLNYSNPAKEEDQEKRAERERRAGIDAYNEATYEESHPIAARLRRMAIAAVAVSASFMMVPKPFGYWVAWAIVITYRVIELARFRIS